MAVLLGHANRPAEGPSLFFSPARLRSTKASFGPDHPFVGGDLNNLATLLLSHEPACRGRAALLRHALKIDEKSVGPRSPTCGQGDLNNLATLLWATNRHTEFELAHRRAIAIWMEKVPWPESSDVAQDLNNLASLLEDQGQWSAAIALYVRAKPIVTGAHGASELERGGLGKTVLAQNTGRLEGSCASALSCRCERRRKPSRGFRACAMGAAKRGGRCAVLHVRTLCQRRPGTRRARARAAGLVGCPRGSLSQPRRGDGKGGCQGRRSRPRSYRGHRG